MSDRQYLLGILVYNGRGVVERCLDSAAALVSDRVVVAVFDDCSPSPGWSAEVAELCRDRGLGYYRAPRNLGIPRNMSLVMRTAVEGWFDVAGLVNSDVVLPANLIETMDAVLDAHPDVGSVTPWSNNVSAFSLPMAAAGPAIADNAFVSQMSRALADVNGSAVCAVPTGVGYCLIIPTTAVRQVGYMDPIFGRGYCEEVDWCQRARAAGLQNVLSLGSFVYHEGSATNRDEGLLAHGMTTVVEHELIIRGRYPDYLSRVEEFFADPSFGERATTSLAEALRRIVRASPYEVVVGDIDVMPSATLNGVVVPASGTCDLVRIAWSGLDAIIQLDVGREPGRIVDALGRPSRVTVIEPGRRGQLFAAWAETAEIEVTTRLSYPNRA